MSRINTCIEFGTSLRPRSDCSDWPEASLFFKNSLKIEQIQILRFRLSKGIAFLSEFIENAQILIWRHDCSKQMLFYQIVFKINQCWISDVAVQNQFVSLRNALKRNQLWAWGVIAFFRELHKAQKWLLVNASLEDKNGFWKVTSEIQHWLTLNTIWLKSIDSTPSRLSLRVDSFSIRFF